jgi:hypothetical protein
MFLHFTRKVIEAADHIAGFHASGRHTRRNARPMPKGETKPKKQSVTFMRFIDLTKDSSTLKSKNRTQKAE